MEFGKIPQGKIEMIVDGTGGSPSYIRWAPGTGIVYKLVATKVNDQIMHVLGGNLMVTLQCAGTFETEFFGFPLGLWHESLVSEHFNHNGRMTEQEVLLYTAMLNWTLGSEKTAHEYANSCWERAGVRKH